MVTKILRTLESSKGKLLVLKAERMANRCQFIAYTKSRHVSEFEGR